MYGNKDINKLVFMRACFVYPAKPGITYTSEAKSKEYFEYCTTFQTFIKVNKIKSILITSLKQIKNI